LQIGLVIGLIELLQIGL